MNSQSERILIALKDGARLTPWDALSTFGCFRLAARIYDLRRAGYVIQKRTVKSDQVHFTEYWI